MLNIEKCEIKHVLCIEGGGQIVRKNCLTLMSLMLSFKFQSHRLENDDFILNPFAILT